MPSPYRIASAPPAVRVDRLGGVVSVHRVRQPATWVGAGLLAFIVAPIAAYFGGPLLFLAAIGAAVTWILATLLTAPRAVVLRGDGLEVKPWIGRARAICFDDCRAVYRDFGVWTGDFGTRVTDHALWLEDNDGQRARVVHNLDHADTLFAAVERRCERPVSLEAARAFDAGEELTFGPLAVSKLDLTMGGEWFDWREVSKVEVSPKRLFVHFRRKLTYRSFPIRRIPYPFVLVRLMERAGARIEGIEGFVTQRS